MDVAGYRADLCHERLPNASNVKRPENADRFRESHAEMYVRVRHRSIPVTKESPNGDVGEDNARVCVSDRRIGDVARGW